MAETLNVRIGTELDERSAAQTTARLERQMAEAARTISGSFGDQASRGFDDMADSAQRAYRRVSEATEDAAREERELQRLRDQGAAGIDDQAERARRARVRESQAIRDATDEIERYDRAVRQAGQSSQDAAGQSSSAFGSMAAAARSAGSDAGDGFGGGFGAGIGRALSGAKGGVVAGFAAIGVAGVKAFSDAVEQGMASLQLEDMTGVRAGLNEEQSREAGRSAMLAYAQGWGESKEENLLTLQYGMQARLIDRDANRTDAAQYVAQAQNLADIMGEDTHNIARGSRTFVSTGLVDDFTAASDLMIAANAKGLNLSEDLLDTLEEYPTVWRQVGISGADALGMVDQMLQGGARNADVAADGIKELALSVTDNSNLTRQAFMAMGFDANDMFRRFAAGGPTARQALDSVLDSLNAIQDPIERNQVGLALFKTKWEDLGKAAQSADLDTAAQRLGVVDGASRNAADAVSAHASQWDLLGRKIMEANDAALTWLANSGPGRFIGVDVPQWLDREIFGNGAPATPPTPGRTVPAGALPPPGTMPGFPVGQGGLTPRDPGYAEQQRRLAEQQAGIDAGQRARNGVPAPAPGDWFNGFVPGPQQGIPTPWDVAGERIAAANAATGGGGGSGGGGADRPVIDPSRYTLGAVPLGSFTGVPIADPYGQLNQRTDILNAQVAVENARKKVLEMEAEGTASDAEIQAAKNEVALKEQAYTKAQQGLVTAQIGATDQLTKTAEGLTSALGSIFAPLADDFGISGGLPGVAENLVKIFGNMALAGAIGSNPAWLASILAEERPTSPTTSGQAYYPTSAAAWSPGGAAGIDAAVMSRVPAGSYDNGVKDLGRGLADCSSSVEDLINIMDGRSTGGGSLTTMNASQLLPGMGFQPGMGGPGDFRVAYNSGHMQATLPGGTNFNWGSDSAAAQRGMTGEGAYDPALTTHYYRPVTAGPDALSTAQQFPQYGVPNGSMAGGIPGRGNGMPESLSLPMNTGVPFPSSPGGGGGGGGAGIGGGIAEAAGALFPGGATAAKLASRTIEFGAQAAAIGVSGLMETFLPAGSEKAVNGWGQRLLGGLAGARPAKPNMAGGQPPNARPGQGGNNDNSRVQNITNNIDARGLEKGNDIASAAEWHQRAQNSGPGW